jgi:hypothetical protein
MYGLRIPIISPSQSSLTLTIPSFQGPDSFENFPISAQGAWGQSGHTHTHTSELSSSITTTSPYTSDTIHEQHMTPGSGAPNEFGAFGQAQRPRCYASGLLFRNDAVGRWDLAKDVSGAVDWASARSRVCSPSMTIA